MRDVLSQDHGGAKQGGTAACGGHMPLVPRCSGVAAPSPPSLAASLAHPEGHAKHGQAQRLAAVLGHPGVGVGGVVHWGTGRTGQGGEATVSGNHNLAGRATYRQASTAQCSASKLTFSAGRTCGDDVQLHGRELAVHQVLAGGVQVKLQRLDCEGRRGGRTGQQEGKQGGRIKRVEGLAEGGSCRHNPACPGARWHRNTATLHRDGMLPCGRSPHRSPGTWRTVLPSAEPLKMACQVSSTTYGGAGAAGGMCHDA